MSNQYDAILDLDPPIDTAASQLEFQNFIHSDDPSLAAGRGKAPSPQRGGGPIPAPGISNAPDFGFSNPTVNPQQQPGQPPATGKGFWTLEYYAQYFNVNTSDVAQRIIATIIPRQKFGDLIGSNPDLYGPFWITTTVIFMLFVTSTIAGSIAAFLSGTAPSYNYDMTLLSVAASTLYFYTSAIPLLIWVVLRYYKGPANLMELLDVYGYAMAIWIPVSIICIVPSEIVRWILVAVAFASSALFKVRTVRPIVQQANDKVASTIVLTIIFAAHGALALLFKFYFFTYTIKVNT
ncbi:hypothetical protein DFS34DRAFT_598673 [Phlyctochytrium arcticum]|nr:hypothetical protein DFS34DRAFT_598673 [Phlyctochytrium arcticum]